MKNKTKLKILKNSIKSLKNVTKIQCSEGNWNSDPYMHGMANGLILALSLFKCGQPVFLMAPEKYLSETNSNSLAKEELISA